MAGGFMNRPYPVLEINRLAHLSLDWLGSTEGPGVGNQAFPLLLLFI